jgi:hypothetical protein
MVYLRRRKVRKMSELEAQLEVGEQVSEQIRVQQQNLEQTLERIDREVQKYRRKESRNGAANTWFRASLAVLGVAAPSLVTYQTQVEGEPLLVLLTIGLTALAGASGTLGAIFRWGDRYTRSMLTAQALEDLGSKTRGLRQEILAVRDQPYQLSGLRALNEDAGEMLRSTINKYVQAEAELAAQDTTLQLPAPATTGAASAQEAQAPPPRLKEPDTTP